MTLLSDDEHINTAGRKFAGLYNHSCRESLLMRLQRKMQESGKRCFQSSSSDGDSSLGDALDFFEFLGSYGEGRRPVSLEYLSALEARNWNTVTGLVLNEQLKVLSLVRQPVGVW